MDAAELYWAYKRKKEQDDDLYHEKYEIARFLGILTRNPKLLNRVHEVLPFSWEKDRKPKKQSVEEMKRSLQAIARMQGERKEPKPKLINLRMEKKRKLEESKKKKT